MDNFQGDQQESVENSKNGTEVLVIGYITLIMVGSYEWLINNKWWDPQQMVSRIWSLLTNPIDLLSLLNILTLRSSWKSEDISPANSS